MADLLSYLHPPDWVNPRPAPIYDLVVIGGGPAGLVCAAGAAGLGARVALVERHRLGGDCLNTGCVPSKALLRSARVVHEALSGRDLGIRATTHVDFGAVMQRVRDRRLALAPHDSAGRFASLGVDVLFGDASFDNERTVVVRAHGTGEAVSRLRFSRAVITAGSRPAVPDLPGLAGRAYLTSDTLFELTEQPATLLIIGAGAVGCEMAQAFALLGTQVTLADPASRVLSREDPDASAIVARALQRAGVRLELGAPPAIGDATVLVAAGRTPNTDGLNLAAAGIDANGSGVTVDDRLRTSNRRVFAAGDVCSPYRFTHAADAMARIVIQNALFHGRKRVSDLVIPWCTYTFPEVAHVGAATDAGAVITVPLADVDRGVTDDEGEGFVRIRHERGQILGATIVARQAGELIGHVAQLMDNDGTLGDLSTTVFPYPTVGEALRKAGDQYRRGSLTPMLQGILRRYFAVTRR